MENKIKELKEYIVKYYKPRALSYSALRSWGNYNDVFEDGYECGFATAVADIINILGIEVIEL